MNTFKFWPVGQGLFYTGSILNGDFNFVYDCGSNDDNYIDCCVDEYLNSLKDRKLIDFIVISHLHYDHFSGLYRLARKAKIKKLYLPYLGDNDEIKTLILANAIFGETTAESRENLYRVFDFMLNLYRVDGGARDDFPYIETDFINNFIDEDKDGVYSIGRAIAINKYWEFSFIAKQISSTRYSDLNKQISALLKKEKVTHVLDLIKEDDGIDKISKIYKSVFKKNQNATSIILVHKPLFNMQTFSPETNLIDNLSFFSDHPCFCNPYCFNNL